MKLHHRILSLSIVMMMILATIQLPVAQAGSPFRNHIIPGTIPLAEFDYGQQGETYSGYKTATHEGKYDYRGDGALMNIYADAARGGSRMGFNRGEWMKYTVNVKKTGLYAASILYAVPYSSQFKVSFDDGAQEILADLPATDGWASFIDYEFGTFVLAEGTHTMVISCVGSGFNVSGVTFESPSAGEKPYVKQEGGYRATTLPAIIEAEDFDLGAAGTISADGKNNLNKYRRAADLDIGINDDEVYFLRLNQNEAANYTFNVEVAGMYSIDVYTPTTGAIKMYIDGSANPINIESDVKSGFECIRAANVYFEKGEHVMTLSAGELYEMDRFEILRTNEEGIDVDYLNDKAYPPEEEEAGEVINPVWKELYVSTTGSDSNDGSADAPFATLERADQEVKAIRSGMEGDIIVNVAGGNYMIKNTLTFNQNSGGANGYRVIYRGDASDKAVLNGGTKVTGWNKIDEKVWKAPLDVEDTRTLYIGDFAARRARSKYKYVAAENYITGEGSTITDGVKVDSRNFPQLTNTEDVELVWELEWTSNRTPVDQIDYGIDGGEKNGIRIAQPAWSKFALTETNPKKVGIGSMFHIENALELLDEPGEFYFDKKNKEIYYYPYEEENLNSLETWVGTTEMLVKVNGAGTNDKVNGFGFENLQFKYGAWNEASKRGIYNRQADSLKDETGYSSQAYYTMPSQVDIKYATDVSIKNCNFEGLGSTAIGMNEGVVNARVVGNNFVEIAGCAVSVDEGSHDHTMGGACERSTHVTVSDNIMWRVANEYRSCPAISAFYVSYFTAEHNDIREIPYTGISVGWGWQSTAIAGIMSNNTVAYNRIIDSCSPTHDGSQIYTLGMQQNTVIHDNWLVKSGDYRGGIYNDEGSQNMKVYNNVIEESVNWLFSRAQVSLKNIVVYDNYTDSSRMNADKDHVTVTNTTVVTDGNWPQEALDIMDNSGVKDKSRLDEVNEKPDWRQSNKETVPRSIYSPVHSSIKQAEDFDPGWNVGYYNAGGKGLFENSYAQTYKEYVYREENNDVYITPESSQLYNFSIGNTKSGDWFQYTYDVETEGDYSFLMRFANGFKLSDPHAKVTLTVDGVTIFDKAELISTGDGDWSKRAVQDFGKVHLTAGTHKVKIEMVDNGWQFDWWAFSDGSAEPLGNEAEFDEGVYVDQIKPVPEFVDIKGHWAESYINKLRDKGIINGISETEFAPERSLSLYETTWLALRALGIEYTDANWKQLAAQNGLLSSANEADGTITRERFAYNIMNAYKVKMGGYNTSVGTKIYTDMDQISPQYEEAVRAANMQNLLTGDDSGAFRPQSALTRAEAATVFYRLVSTLGY